MKKLMSLTDEQRDRMTSFADEWIERGWRTTPLTEEEWKVVEDGMRRCYEYAGKPWPGNVVRVASPIVGVFAAPVAQFEIELRRNLLKSQGVWSDGAVDGAVRDAVDGAVRDAVRGAVRDAVRGAVRDAVHGAVDDAVDGAVRGAVDDAVDDAVDGAVRDAVRDAVDGAVHGAVGGAVHGAVHDAVRGAVDDAVDGAVRGAVGGAVHGAVDGAVHGAVHGAVDGAVDGAVHDAVHGAVRGAVHGAVRQVIQNRWYYRLGGRLWPTWQAYVAYFRDIVNLQLDGDTWDRSRAYEDAQGAGWWWPFKDFVMVCEPPVELHLEQVGPRGWGSHRLHCETGPAVRWSDGWGVYSWHGTNVPAWVIENPTVEKAMAERNTEIRRCALEAIGWGELEPHLGDPIDVCADPGNAPHELKLYRLPDKLNSYGQPINLLLMTNGSPDRSGSLRRYGETVPAQLTSAIAAASWQYGVDPSAYAQLTRRT